MSDDLSRRLLPTTVSEPDGNSDNNDTVISEKPNIDDILLDAWFPPDVLQDMTIIVSVLIAAAGAHGRALHHCWHFLMMT